MKRISSLTVAVIATLVLLAGFVLHSGHRSEPEAPKVKENPDPAIRITLKGHEEAPPENREEKEEP